MDKRSGMPPSMQPRFDGLPFNAPPSYEEALKNPPSAQVLQQMQRMQAPIYPAQQVYPTYQIQGYPQMAPQAAAQPVYYYHQPPRPVFYPGQQVLVQDTFDAGARFANGNPPSIPPAPPGVMPSAAQLAAQAGATVVANQKKENFFTGGRGGGSTFW